CAHGQGAGGEGNETPIVVGDAHLPELGRPAEVDRHPGAGQPAFSGGSQVIDLELQPEHHPARGVQPAANRCQGLGEHAGCPPVQQAERLGVALDGHPRHDPLGVDLDPLDPHLGGEGSAGDGLVVAHAAQAFACSADPSWLPSILATSAFGAIRQNLWACSFQSAMSPAERADPVNSACWATRFLRKVSCGPSGLALDTSSGFTLAGRDSSGSYTYAWPPVIPAPRFQPVGPRITVVPPVMYSQAWSPAPSTTVVAPELRTQKRSPDRPATKSRPPVAP